VAAKPRLEQRAGLALDGVPLLDLDAAEVGEALGRALQGGARRLLVREPRECLVENVRRVRVDGFAAKLAGEVGLHDWMLPPDRLDVNSAGLAAQPASAIEHTFGRPGRTWEADRTPVRSHLDSTKVPTIRVFRPYTYPVGPVYWKYQERHRKGGET